MKRMLRHMVTVDGGAQTVSLQQGDVVHVAATRDAHGKPAVEFWSEGSTDGEDFLRTFQVFGTGHDLPENAVWRGTAERTPEGWVWHLYELFGGVSG